uniref:Uncharacterized protein n=1 Tax=Candidatus Kentrum sp. TUN TaxID=2126343 RepID=A0A451B1E8_9GAMM|nr:MAG: hypothetical protein BECKTUN1418E_GA0071001_13501 [Candidatus Kentron sp. TUN]
MSAEAWIARFDDSRQGTTYDIPLRTQLNKGKTILLGMVGRDTKGRGRLLLPVPDLLYALPNGTADVGLGNMSTYADGVVRQFRPAFSEDEIQPRLGFGILLARRCREEGVFIHAGGAQYARIHGQDIGHGHEGGDAGDDFGFDVRVVLVETEKLFHGSLFFRIH